MLNRRKLMFVVCACTAFAGPLIAQQQENAPAESKSSPAKFYRLDFVVQEVEAGKVVNGRNYTLIGSTSARSSLRTGNRVPYMSGLPNMQQVNFMEVGVNIDCWNLREIGNGLALEVSADATSMAPTPENMPNAPPVTRQNRWTSGVVLPVKKPTVIFSSDDLNSKRKLQLELTATPIG